MVEEFAYSTFEKTGKYFSKKTEDMKFNDSTVLSLENRNLMEIPQNILCLIQLKRLSLNGNYISTLPDEFFKAFPQLTWLDLRCNKLESISRGIINLSNLKSLLIGNNNIRRLCTELGGIRSLTGLNIEGNPIEFPPQDILSKGSSYIIWYLRMCYLKRVELEKLVSGKMNEKCLHDSGDNDWIIQSLDQLAAETVNNKIKSEEINKSEDDSPLYESKLYRRLKGETGYFNKIRKCGYCHPQRSVRQTFPYQVKDELVSVESVHKNELNEIHRLKCKMENIQRDRAIQKLKDEKIIDDWKADYRIRQSNLLDIYKYKLQKEIKEESLNRIHIVPYDIDGDEISVMSQHDLEQLKFAPKPAISSPPRPRPRGADYILKLEIARWGLFTIAMITGHRSYEDNKLIDDVNKEVVLLSMKIANTCLPLSVSEAETDLVNALQLQQILRYRQDIITQLKMSTNPTAFLM